MPNRLANETSPYLRQHADNPVDWYPWGTAALERAKREDRPVLLSIGYAACHWCHVMAHESFEDEGIARLMNDLFVNVKVDREERPDLDGIYMRAVQAMTGSGGWPMTMILTPDGVPFFGGTYFPPEDRHGMPSFRRVLLAAADAYRTKRSTVEQTAAAVRELYAGVSAPGPVGTRPSLTRGLLDGAYAAIARQYDAAHGGFGAAPKFPQPMVLEVLLDHWARTGTPGALEMAHHTFRRMARGGMYDQVGGGFARYAVDAQWLVPHFEKMLYDNALLSRLGVHLWQATRDPEVRRVTEETLDWAAREMLTDVGGFTSSLDADSEGDEGRFYLWDEADVQTVLGADAALATSYWGVTAAGNFEGRNILHVPNDPAAAGARLGLSAEHVAAAIARARSALYAVRAKRVWPSRDDKVLASWNGLMLRALAEASRAFERPDYLSLAERTGDFLFRTMVRDGRVMRSFNAGEARIPAFLEDYAALGLGALALYEATFDATWLGRARALADAMVRWFWAGEDEEAGGGAFYDTARDHEALITRPRDVTDNAIPSGTALAAELLIRIAALTEDVKARERATRVVESLAEPMARYPLAFGHLLGVAGMLVFGTTELALVGDTAVPGFQRLARAAAHVFVPALVVAGGAPQPEAASGGIALLTGKSTVEGRSAAYVCRDRACQAPVTEPEALTRLLAPALLLPPR